MRNIFLIVLTFIAVSVVHSTFAMNHVPAQEWAEYKAKFNKNYDKGIGEAYAQYYYAYNKRMIDRHNKQYERGQKAYKLAVNQFTDMRLIHFNALFPVAADPTEPSHDSPPPPVEPASTSYDPINDFGFASNIENQGTKCNSGWAYAAAKSIELFQAQQAGNMAPASLSAQNLIDCAGRLAACKNQVPQAAFDYLTQFNMDLLLESDYNNQNNLSEQGMCTPKGQLITNLRSYSRLKDGDDESLKAYTSNGFPVVVEFNPTSFDFMHYSEGIFEPPTPYRGSHFMVVLGYGTDTTTGMDYWLLQNSFDTTWGEMGLMRLSRSALNNITKNAIFPTELA